MNKKRLLILCLVSVMLLSSACSGGNKGPVEYTEWESKHPEHVAMFKENEEMTSTTYGGSEPYSYLDAYPYLKVFYDGYVFSVQYDRARGHVYALEDVLSTKRPKKAASCLACKTSEYNEALMKDKSVCSMNFDKFVKEHNVHIGMTCFDCHGDEPGTIDVRRVHLTDALEENPALKEELSEKELTCAQCHAEYYQKEEDAHVVLPWKKGFGATEALEYYDEIGFYDWIHPGTGAKLLKAQHPETETFSGSKHDAMGLDCIDCHMPMVEKDGKEVHNHHWTSPLKHTTEEACLKCHSDQTKESLTKWVESLQMDVTHMMLHVGGKLEKYILALTEAKEQGLVTGEALEDYQDAHRKAQFYWDYVFVENGEGFHNHDKQMEYLKMADDILDEYRAKLQNEKAD